LCQNRSPLGSGFLLQENGTLPLFNGMFFLESVLLKITPLSNIPIFRQLLRGVKIFFAKIKL
jgi:hypothetical protein